MIAQNFIFSNQLPTYTAQHPRRAKVSITSRCKPEIYAPSYWKLVYSIQVYLLQYHNWKGFSYKQNF